MASPTSQPDAKRKRVQDQDDDDNQRVRPGVHGLETSPQNIFAVRTPAGHRSRPGSSSRSSGSNSRVEKRASIQRPPCTRGCPNGICICSGRRIGGHSATQARVSPGQGTPGQKRRAPLRPLVPAGSSRNSSVLENERQQRNLQVSSGSMGPPPGPPALPCLSVANQDNLRPIVYPVPQVVPSQTGRIGANQQFRSHYNGMASSIPINGLPHDDCISGFNSVPMRHSSYLPEAFPVPNGFYQDVRSPRVTIGQQGQLHTPSELAYLPSLHVRDPRQTATSRLHPTLGSNRVSQAPMGHSNPMMQGVYAPPAPTPSLQPSMPVTHNMSAQQQNPQATWPVAVTTYQTASYNTVAQPQPTPDQAGLALQPKSVPQPPAQMQGPLQTDLPSYLSLSNQQYTAEDWQRPHRFSVAASSMSLQQQEIQVHVAASQQEFDPFAFDGTSGMEGEVALFEGPTLPQTDIRSELELWAFGPTAGPVDFTVFEDLVGLDVNREVFGGNGDGQDQGNQGGNAG